MSQSLPVTWAFSTWTGEKICIYEVCAPVFNNLNHINHILYLGELVNLPDGPSHMFREVSGLVSVPCLTDEETRGGE